MSNYTLFETELAAQYKELYESDPEYSYSASIIGPNELATKMTKGLLTGSASKDGKAIKNVCKKLKIKHTYKEIKEFLEK